MFVISNYRIGGANPVTVGGTGTAAKYFPAVSSNFTSGASTTPTASSAVGQLNVPGDYRLDGQPFNIYAAGDFEVGSGGACPNVTILVRANTSKTSTPSYTTIGSTGALSLQPLTGTFYPWMFEFHVQGTNNSGILQGWYEAVVDGVIQNSTPKAIDNVLTGLTFGTTSSKTSSDPVFGLVVSVTFSVSESGNKANMHAFYVSV